MDPASYSTNPYDDDHLHEECAVFGIYGTKDAAIQTVLGLHALQHRGQEAVGIVSFDGANFHAHRGAGHVGHNFDARRSNVVERLAGHAAIGHTRYSTTGGDASQNIQPLFADFSFGGLAVCHNGNLTNALELRRALVEAGAIFQSTTDTETVLHLTAQSRKSSVRDRITEALAQVEGAFSFIYLTHSGVIGIRDPRGVRPLVLGRVGNAWVLASETCALDVVGAEFVRDVAPGEMVILDENGVTSLFPFRKAEKRFCVFEYIYFSRPDSIVEGISTYGARKAIGAELAKEYPVDADVVVPIPDSSVPAAIGFAESSELPFELGIIRSHYVGRTFIQPTDEQRNLGVKMKHNSNRAMLEGRRVVLVDDSIVRGTTSKEIVRMVRAAGATEVHMRIASPPTRHSCFYGVDTPERHKLLAARMSVEEIRTYLEADSLAYVSIDGLYRAMGLDGRNAESPAYCDACFTGDYPIAPTDHLGGSAGKQLTLLT